MEPLDPTNNDEGSGGSGFSKRRISSILKAPRKSIRFAESEQQENTVECAKPVEKRISRRVSFAPANDVLLFSKDVKNSSPVRGPLQELTTPAAATTQNRIQMMVTEDGIQQITGMETLLNAPLHGLQQKDKANFNTGNDFGEKTVMFHTDDAFMDMTNCHTINIANDSVFLEDTLHQNNDVLPTFGEKTLMFSAGDGSMDMTLNHTLNMTCSRDSLTTGKNMDLSVEKKNRSPAVPDLDPGFKNFLANLLKQSASSVNPMLTKISPISGPSSEKTGATNASLAHLQTQSAVLDKENQAPPSVSAVRDKSLNTTKKFGESFNRSTVGPDNNMSMDITEVQTGCIMGFTDEDNPFQCLFPTQEMYAETENRSQTADNLKTSQQESSKTLGSSTVRAPAVTEKRVLKVIADDRSQQIADEKSLIHPSVHTSHHRLEVNFNTKDGGPEKTIVFSTDDAFMDMTQSQTINIASVPLAPSSQNVEMLLTCGKKNNASLEQRKSAAGATSANHLDPGFKNLFTSLSTPGGPVGNPVITTKFPNAQTSSKKSGKTDVSLSQLKSSNVTICFEDDVSMDMTEAQTGRIMGFTDTDPFQSLFPTQDMYEAQQKNNDTLGSSNRKGLETSFKSSLKTNAQKNQVKFDSEEDCRDRTVRFTAEDACMDVTQSCTVNIATDFEPQAQEKMNLLPKFGEKTIRFNANDGSMDVTSSHTVNIDTDFEPQAQEKMNILPKFGEKTIRFNANDASMDVTRSHTVNIDTDFEPQAQEKGNLLPAFGEKTVRFNTNDASMDVTRSHTVNIDTDLLLHSHQDLDFIPACGEKTVRFNANDAAMDMTQCLAVNIASNFGMSSSSSTAVNMSSSLIQNQDPSGMSFIGRKTVETSNGVVIGPDDNDDVSMEITEAQTGRIIGVTGSEDALQWKAEMVPRQQRAGLGSSNNKGMDSTLRAPLQPKMQRHQVKRDAEEDLRERTVRFTIEEACMDVTRSHTVNIATGCVLQSKQNVDFLPSFGEKTLKFDADDACMDVTRCHTVNISPTFGPQAEKTLRFTAEDACMDVTKSHTVNIATDLEPQPLENLSPLNKFPEKTVKCHANDASVDLKHSHTVNIATDLKPKSLRKSALLPRSEEKTLRFSTDDAAMDMTQCLTVNIGVGSDIPQADSDVLPTTGNMDSAVEDEQHVTSAVQRSRSSLAHSLDPASKTILSRTSGPWANPVVNAADTPASESDTEGSLGHFQTQQAHVDTENKLSSLVSDVMEKPVNESMKNNETLNKSEHCQEDDVSMDMTEAQTGHILGHTFTDPSQCPPVEDLHPNADKAPSQDSGEASSTNHVEFNNPPDSSDLDETRKDHEERNKAGALPQESNSPAKQDVKVPSHKSRRMSLADIQSKVRRLSQMINSAPDDIAMESSIPPLSQLEENISKNSDKTKSLSEVEPDLKLEERKSENITQAPIVLQDEPPSTSATPFNLKTKQLMSRLSVGGFKPKLPSKSKPDPKKADSSLSKGEHTKTITINVPNHLSSFDHDVSDIYDEELGSYEDMSETLDMRSPQKDTEKPQEFNIDVKLGDDVCEQDVLSASFGKKRPLLEEENNVEGEKRMKQSKDVTEMGIQSEAVECDSNITAAPSVPINDSSTSGHTASMRCEATFESTWKQSLFESQIEDYASDIQMKFDEGTLTVLEFFKLFNIDFVIHNPRQSVLPGRLLSDTDRTPMDLLKDRHISHPKQLVYEANVQSLTEQVEGLKVRMRDLDKPLKIVNRPLWEEMANFSETELKAFGAKLKERNNLFRKMSKVQSHEMKEVLYSNLVQVNLEEQNKLRAKIEEADEMIKSLDDCILQIQTDLAAVEQDVKSRQEGLKKVTEALADSDRKMSELEMQKKQNVNKVKRLKNEAKNFESHMTILHTINEWKLGEKRDNCTVYTFLHETLHLELVFEKTNGNDAGNESELKIANISFKHQLDDEKSQFHAHFVHLLVSQYTTGETDWVKKYPTSQHVPQLLHDVSLVVSRCRLLGEELHRLKLWGSLRFDILDISCTGTEVHIVFSSLKAMSKFEVVLSVSLVSHVCVLQVQSFRNIIGCTTIQQIEEIVASFTPGNNVLTKIVKNIHSSLLC